MDDLKMQKQTLKKAYNVRLFYIKQGEKGNG